MGRRSAEAFGPETRFAESPKVAAMARALAEKATGTPAYLLDEEIFDGFLQEAREAIALMPPEPEPTPLQEAIRKARGDNPTAEEIEQSIGFLNRVGRLLSRPTQEEKPEGGR